MNAPEMLIRLGPESFRTVGRHVVAGKIKVPATQNASSRVWRQSFSYSCPDVGDIDPAPFEVLDRAPPAPGLESRMFSWLRKNVARNLGESVSLNAVACRAAPFHHDVSCFAHFAFCVVWLEESCGLDLVFPHLQKRIPLEKGTIVLFDSAQVHGVVHTGRDRFLPAEYESLTAQLFLSADIELTSSGIAGLMGIEMRSTDSGWSGPVVKAGVAGSAIDPETGRVVAPLR